MAPRKEPGTVRVFPAGVDREVEADVVVVVASEEGEREPPVEFGAVVVVVDVVVGGGDAGVMRSGLGVLAGSVAVEADRPRKSLTLDGEGDLLLTLGDPPSDAICAVDDDVDESTERLEDSDTFEAMTEANLLKALPLLPVVFVFVVVCMLVVDVVSEGASMVTEAAVAAGHAASSAMSHSFSPSMTTKLFPSP